MTPDETPPRGVRVMAILRWVLILVMAVVAALSVAYSFGLVSGGAARASSIQYFCPMHPQVVQDHPGECPICSMTLVQRESAVAPPTPHPAPPSGATETASSGATAPGVPGLAPVELGLDRVQTIGVRTARATQRQLEPELRTVGWVTTDETRVARVHARFSGWIEELAVAETGQKVVRGQVLAGLYNLELLPAQQEFLAARRWGAAGGARAPSGEASQASASLERDGRARLELFGLSPAEIEEMAKTGRPARTVAITSPISGHVIRKDAVRGAYVQPGTELFEIADLSKVWVLADIPQYDMARVQLGLPADVVVAAYPAERFSGKLAFLYPTLDPSTHTLRARIELDNPELRLRPGMYGDVLIHLDTVAGLVVPSEALVDTGEHQYVFIAKDGGRFEPRPVRAGTRSNDEVQILEGLSPGELVVTTANFLIDSESRLRAAIEAAPSPGDCDAEFDAAQFPDKHTQCLACQQAHPGTGVLEADCKNAIPRPWR